MVDEAHERSIYTDLLLGVLKKCAGFSPCISTSGSTANIPPCHFRIRRVRPDLRIIISSATIDAASFVEFFNTQPPSSAIASSGITAADELMPPPAKKSRWDKQEKMPKSEAVMVRLEGRVFPVEIAYLDEPTADVVMKVVETIFDIHIQVRCASSSLRLFSFLSDSDPFLGTFPSNQLVTSWCS